MHLLECNVSLDLTTGDSEMNEVSEDDDLVESAEHLTGNFDALISDETTDGKTGSFLPLRRNLYSSLI